MWRGVWSSVIVRMQAALGARFRDVLQSRHGNGTTATGLPGGLPGVGGGKQRRVRVLPGRGADGGWDSARSRGSIRGLGGRRLPGAGGKGVGVRWPTKTVSTAK